MERNLSALSHCRKKITDGPHETPTFIDSGIPFLSVDGIKDDEIVFNGERYISEEQHEEFIKKARPQKNDIFMGKSASKGKIARVKYDFQFSIWSPLALIRPNTEKIDPRYLEYSMKSAYVQDQIENLCTSSTQKNVSMDAIPRIKILYPSMKTQIVVGSFLDKKSTELDQLIGAKQRRLKLLDEKKRALIVRAVIRGLNPDAPLKIPVFPGLV
jgi:type I restriction enzyme, S subunit